MPPLPRMAPEFTLGNLLSMITTLIAMATVVYYTGSVISELRGKDLLHEERLDRLERSLERSDSDHDILIEIRSDLRILRQQIGLVVQDNVAPASPSRVSP